MIITKKKSLVAYLAACISTPLLASTNTENTLSEDSYWLQLGHYRRAVISDWKSEVDDPRFFLASNGKTDPNAELQATIAAFNGEGLTAAQTQQVKCQFPARFTWLKENIDNNWQALDCPALSQWQTVIDPQGLTLVFPTAFMNDPASMFGHTLLRIDAKDQTRNKELVAFAVNFAAQPDAGDNAALYAFKGFVGLYPGNFTLMPYYRKVREYNDLESRDIWEYKLNFSSDEVQRVLLHLWELQQANFDYYFIDENCSYQLLALLQLAREDLDLTSAFTMQAIPSETVAVLSEAQLLQQINYRPAFGTKLFSYSQQLSDQDLYIARQVMEGKPFIADNYSPQRAAAILEMAYEWLNFEFYDQVLDRDTIAPRLTGLLIQRSKIKTASPFAQPSRPPASPEQGHGSSRLGLSAFSYKDSATAYSLSYRLAYHDLLDQSAGYIGGAQISFLDIEASIDDQRDSRIERFYLLDGMSLAPDNRVFDSWSWNIRIGYDRQIADLSQQGRWFMQGGYGKSYGDPNDLHAYFLGSAEINGGDITDHNISPGVGGELGAVWQLNNNHKAALTGSIMWLPDSDADYHSEVALKWNWGLSQSWALRTQVSYQKWQGDDNKAQVSLYHYF